MKTAFIVPLVVIAASALTAFQPLVNTHLRQHVDSPIWVSFISFLTGSILLLAIGLTINGRFMVLETGGLKWWMFVSGAIGAAYVTVAFLSVPYIGMAVLATLSTSAVLITAAILDHFGILAVAPNPITWQKMVGMILLAAGAVITLKS